MSKTVVLSELPEQQRRHLIDFLARSQAKFTKVDGGWATAVQTTAQPTPAFDELSFPEFFLACGCVPGKAEPRSITWLVGQIERLYDARYAVEAAEAKKNPQFLDTIVPFHETVALALKKEHGRLPGVLEHTATALAVSLSSARLKILSAHVFSKFLEGSRSSNELSFYLYARDVLRRRIRETANRENSGVAIVMSSVAEAGPATELTATHAARNCSVASNVPLAATSVSFLELHRLVSRVFGTASLVKEAMILIAQRCGPRGPAALKAHGAFLAAPNSLPKKILTEPIVNAEIALDALVVVFHRNEAVSEPPMSPARSPKRPPPPQRPTVDESDLYQVLVTDLALAMSAAIVGRRLKHPVTADEARRLATSLEHEVARKSAIEFLQRGGLTAPAPEPSQKSPAKKSPKKPVKSSTVKKASPKRPARAPSPARGHEKTTFVRPSRPRQRPERPAQRPRSKQRARGPLPESVPRAQTAELLGLVKELLKLRTEGQAQVLAHRFGARSLPEAVLRDLVADIKCVIEPRLASVAEAAMSPEGNHKLRSALVAATKLPVGARRRAGVEAFVHALFDEFTMIHGTEVEKLAVECVRKAQEL